MYESCPYLYSTHTAVLLLFVTIVLRYTLRIVTVRYCCGRRCTVMYSDVQFMLEITFQLTNQLSIYVSPPKNDKASNVTAKLRSLAG